MIPYRYPYHPDAADRCLYSSGGTATVLAGGVVVHADYSACAAPGNGPTLAGCSGAGRGESVSYCDPGTHGAPCHNVSLPDAPPPEDRP